jgi:hypothetical protein
MTIIRIIHNELIRFSYNPWFQWLTLILGTVIGIIGIIMAARAKRIKIPVYTTKTFNLIQGKIQAIDDIQIIYKKSQIHDFSISKIALWNNGKETINKADIANSDKLRIVPIGNVKLLNAQIIFEKNNVNNFSLNLENIEKEVLINFDFFDFEEGIILQVFHTGKTGNDIEIKGTIKGFGSIKKDFSKLVSIMNKPTVFFEKIGKKSQKFILGIFSILVPFILLFSSIKPQPETKNMLISKYLIVLISASMYWPLAYIILKKRVPRGFELFEVEIKLS